MNIKTALGLAVILTLAFVLAAQYKTAPNRPSDFRDAVGSEGAAGQLQNAAPADQDLNQPAIPAPQAAESAAAQSPESGNIAAQSASDDQGVTRIFSENDLLHKRLAQALGINYPCTVETKHIGAAFQQTEKLTLDDGRRKESVVVKRTSASFVRSFGIFMWAAFMKITSLSKLDKEADAVKMAKNGVAMNEKFRNAGLKTLEIVLADPESQILVTKFLKGTSLPSILQTAFQNDAGAMQNIKRLGSALATAHRNNFSIGDLNSGNVMFANGEPYFIDLDRATVGGAKGWDIALFFYDPILTIRPSAEPQAWALVARSFLRGYLAGGGDTSIVKDALDRKYIAPSAQYITSLAPAYALRSRSSIHAVRHEMKKAAGENLSPETDEALGLAP